MALEELETLPLESREPTASIASNPWRDFVNLFIISFLVLFFELACIRWFGSMVIFLTFFTNIVLMACFLGMSVGCLAPRRDAITSKPSTPDTGDCDPGMPLALGVQPLRQDNSRRRRAEFTAADLLRDGVSSE
jgi:hypothetical protein